MTLSRKSYQNKVITFNQYKFDILKQCVERWVSG